MTKVPVKQSAGLPCRIAVTGDISYHCNIYLPADPDQGAKRKTRFAVTLGGGAIVHNILKQCAAASQDGPVLAISYTKAEQESPVASNPIAGLWHLYEAGRLFKPATIDAKPCRVWRLQRSIHLGQAQELADAVRIPELPADDKTAESDILVINDDGGPFRFGPGYVHWPSILTSVPSSLKWVVLKMTYPLCVGDLWWNLALNANMADKLVVVLKISDLRKHTVRISEGVSWERTALDLASELMNNPMLADLKRARHVVVALRSEGGLVMSKHSAGVKFQLVFDPEHMENEWPKSVSIDGDAYGYTAVMAAAITAELAKAEPNMPAGIGRGLTACRLLRAMGHGPDTQDIPQIPYRWLGEVIGQDETKTPWTVGDSTVSRKSLGSWKLIDVPSDMAAIQSSEANQPSTGRHWRILERAGSDSQRLAEEPLYGMARRMAVFGAAKGLGNVPIAQFGKLVTVDRDEIEALRNIKRLIQQYKDDPENTKPLSLAVFGPPGAGKSFGVIQIAQEVLDKNCRIRTFNLSQFDPPEGLVGMFHQVRDMVLEGGTPVIFWDEFDSRSNSWLQYFLAPMQDGKFQEGQHTSDRTLHFRLRGSDQLHLRPLHSGR
ncbi:MAG: hypothetical protein ABSB33_06435 [Tepidisphaeraceae bacterium]|jgi:hypothetical protein